MMREDDKTPLPRSMAAARARKVVGERLIKAVESSIDDIVAQHDGRDLPQALLAGNHSLLAQLAGAFCAIVQMSDTHGMQLCSAPLCRDLLRMVADDLRDSSQEMREADQDLPAGMMAATADELEKCADELDGISSAAVGLVRKARGVFDPGEP